MVILDIIYLFALCNDYNEDLFIGKKVKIYVNIRFLSIAIIS